MKVYIGADHGGFDLKTQLLEHLTHNGLEVIDVGAASLDDDDDYPKYAFSLTTKLIAEEEGAALGVLICRSGQGMAIAANRVRGIRAALAWDKDSAEHARCDDDANVLVLPADYVQTEQAFEMVDAWLDAKFKADPKYHRRLDEIEEIYG